jgi:hypothetical protein
LTPTNRLSQTGGWSNATERNLGFARAMGRFLHEVFTKEM